MCVDAVKTSFFFTSVMIVNTTVKLLFNCDNLKCICKADFTFITQVMNIYIYNARSER